jgi:predicted hydrocarbon binding protein
MGGIRKKMKPKEKEDRINYLIKKQRGGEFLHENFLSIHLLIKKKKGSIRPQLGDFIHMKFSTLHDLSLAYYYPLSIYEMYRLGKLLGYYSALEIEKNFKEEVVVGSDDKYPSEKIEIWDLLQNEKIQSKQEEYWRAMRLGIPKLITIDKKKKILRYGFKKINQPIYFYSLGILSGQIEAISGYYCKSIENIQLDNENNENEYPKIYTFDFYLSENEEQIRFPSIEKSKLILKIDNILDNLLLIFLQNEKEKEVIRWEELGDFVHISKDQAINYTLLSISQGHTILTKWAGRKLGERLIKKTKKNSLMETLDFLKDLFFKLKIGILEYELDTERIIIKIEESVYSFGVTENIEMKLCAFLTGIFQGSLFQATNTRWIVKEKKCTANGDDNCEFICRTENPESLRGLLIGT